MEISKITVENMQSGCVTDETNPIVAFALKSDVADTSLKCARVTIADMTVNVTKQTDIAYCGVGLKPFSDYTVKVEAEDNHGNVAVGQTKFKTGRLGLPWQAKWICGDDFKKKKCSPVPQTFRKRIGLKKSLAKAEICCTSWGIFKLYIDNAPVGNDYFAPGFTSYKHNLQYMYYDVTSMMHDGVDLVAVVAGGWAVGSYTHARINKIFADKPMLLCELRLTYADGSVEVIGTDKTWQFTNKGNFIQADLYDGEIYDATVDLDKALWCSSRECKPKLNPALSVSYGAPVRAHEELLPVSCVQSEDGTLLYDFGQNFAGVIDFTIVGKQGQVITFKHSEILQDGKIFTEPLRSAKQTVEYIAKEGVQQYSPTFTYMGFRYVQVQGISSEKISIRAKALYSDLPVNGTFNCSDERLNKLQSNIVWSAKSNLVDIPTDCPQRDERMGWTGDIAMFAPTACFNFDMSRFFCKWLTDVVSEQTCNGAVPVVVPHVAIPGNFETTFTFPIDFWGDACVLVPWTEYLASGSKRILQRCYGTMKSYVNACKRLASMFSLGKNRYVWNFHHYGDWCAADGNWKDWMSRGKWTATACLYNSSKILSQVANILGYNDDAEYYSRFADKVADAYVGVFTDGKGKLKKEFQTAYVLPIAFGMFDEMQNNNAVSNLVRLVRENNFCIGTGFTATPYILFALADNGYAEDAFKMLLCEQCPSWLYQVDCGATTIWERWDALTKEGQFNNKEVGDVMVSFNHYANGSVGSFLYKRILGIYATEAGYKKFTVKPILGGEITQAEGGVDTLYGKIYVKWTISEKSFCLTVEVPVSTECMVVLPDGSSKVVYSGLHNFQVEL